MATMIEKMNDWTDDELDMLDVIGTNMLGVDDSDDVVHTDADITEWSTEVELDALDFETEELENY